MCRDSVPDLGGRASDFYPCLGRCQYEKALKFIKNQKNHEYNKICIYYNIKIYKAALICVCNRKTVENNEKKLD